LDNEILNFLIKSSLIDCGELTITRTTMGKKKQGERFLIYLPNNRSYLWKLLHEKSTKVRVYIQIPRDLKDCSSRED
jgi:hypothetical protein